MKFTFYSFLTYPGSTLFAYQHLKIKFFLDLSAQVFNLFCVKTEVDKIQYDSKVVYTNCKLIFRTYPQIGVNYLINIKYNL